MRKPLCKPARRIALELEADKIQEWYDRTHSQKALVKLVDARRKAMAG